MDTLSFDLVTPEATFFSGPATLVEAPGTLGDFGVLPGHMNFISTLKPGVVRVHAEGSGETSVFVSGGIAEVNAVSCTILAERVVDLATITRAEAESRLEAARKQADNAFDEDAKFEANRELELAEALLAALA